METCNFCDHKFSDDLQGEKWVKCVRCICWPHEACSGSDKPLHMRLLHLILYETLYCYIIYNYFSNLCYVLFSECNLENLSSKHEMVSITVDETSDCVHHEQMSVVVRYFDVKTNVPLETFVGLRRLTYVNAEFIYSELSEVLSFMKIEWKNVLAVCFDGASTMAGTLSGVQARCKENNSKILYAHCLNLALVAACSSQRENKLVFDFFGVVPFTYSFIEGICVRHDVFEKLAKEGNNSVNHLKSLSINRWACRAEAVSAIKENYKATVLAIEDILQNTTHADW